MNLKQLIFGGVKPAAGPSPAPKNSTQNLVAVTDIQNGIVITNDGRLVKIVEVLPVNFYLKSSMEQQEIIYAFAAYLKIAPDDLQIKVISQKADVGDYEIRMRAHLEQESDENCRAMIEDNIAEVRWLAQSAAVTRRFFLVFQDEGGGGFEDACRRLDEAADNARRYLDRCGLETVHHGDEDLFLLNLLYSEYNKRSSTGTRLTSDIYAMTGAVHSAEPEEGGETK